MAWYNLSGNNPDIAFSSRAVLSRNLVDYPFAYRLEKEAVCEITEKIKNVLANEGFEFISFDDKSAAQKNVYVQRQYCTKKATSVFINEQDGTSVSVCADDHIQINCTQAGLCIQEVFDKVFRIDDLIDSRLTYAFNEKFGFFTFNPENIGTGAHLSVTLFLPALASSMQIDGLSSALSKFGLDIIAKDGALYEITNRNTLGVSEDEIIQKTSEAVKCIFIKESELRKAYLADDADRLSDRIMRSLGILRYCRMLSSSEISSFWADVRLGIALGIIEDVSYETMSSIIINIMPPSRNSDFVSDANREILRAECVKKELC